MNEPRKLIPDEVLSRLAAPSSASTKWLSEQGPALERIRVASAAESKGCVFCGADTKEDEPYCRIDCASPGY